MNSQKTSSYIPFLLVFLLFSMLLNCMGLIILQYSRENISYRGLGFLESFKDLPIALASILLVRVISNFGTKKALMASMIFVGFCCLLLPLVSYFWFIKLWFSLIGVGFAVGKISTFSLLSANYKSKKLAQVMNLVEASFMLGIFVVNMGFGYLLNSAYSEYWLYGFWLIGLFAFINFFLLWKGSYQEIKEDTHGNMISNFTSIFSPKVTHFLFIMLLIVFTEQCLNTWLPVFYKDNFNVSSQFALQSSAFLALFSFTGRFITSRIIHRVNWFKLLYISMLALVFFLVMIFLLISYFPELNSALVYLIPLIGLFISPLYPVFNSKMLSTYSKAKTNQLISGLVIFSSLGSSLGSIFIATVFHQEKTTLYPILILVPIVLLLLLSVVFKKKYFPN